MNRQIKWEKLVKKELGRLNKMDRNRKKKRKDNRWDKNVGKRQKDSEKVHLMLVKKN